jgi:hypothetical protein
MIQKSLWLLALLASTSSISNAQFLSRLGGQAQYDPDLGITWLTDANYAQTSGYDADGRMTWSAAQAWIASLNAANHLGTNDWRLPKWTDLGPNIGCDGTESTYTGADCGYNVILASGEMADLFYNKLGNTGWYDTSGNPTGCPFDNCLTNDGPFSHMFSEIYWYGTEDPSESISAMFFWFRRGLQYVDIKTFSAGHYAWAVRDGDIGTLDPDGDGISNLTDNCYAVPNADQTDTDSDGAGNMCDNCRLEANSSQCDADGDNYGNLCDADLNNTGLVTSSDYSILRAALNMANAVADLNCSGLVTSSDYTILRSKLNKAPGPGAGP